MSSVSESLRQETGIFLADVFSAEYVEGVHVPHGADQQGQKRVAVAAALGTRGRAELTVRRLGRLAPPDSAPRSSNRAGMASHASSQQWIRRCILEASEEDREYGVATVLGPTWVDRTGEIYCNLIDRTHCIGCVLTAAALEYSVSNWTETLDGALVLVEDASPVLNQDKKQFNLRVAKLQVMRTSTGRDPENVISCFVMDDPEVKRAYERAMVSCTRPLAAPPPPPPAEESFLDRSRRSYPMACAAFPVQPEGGAGDFSILPQMLRVPPDQQRQLDALMRAHTASAASSAASAATGSAGYSVAALRAAIRVSNVV